MENKEEFQEVLNELQEKFAEAKKIREEQAETWWNNLPYEEKELAFYSVVKRIYKAEILDRGTYRYALYDVFGFDMGMYADGMTSGYMEIHNCIGRGLED